MNKSKLELSFSLLPQTLVYAWGMDLSLCTEIYPHTLSYKSVKKTHHPLSNIRHAPPTVPSSVIFVSTWMSIPLLAFYRRKVKKESLVY
jgi:hypothetical protein